MPVPPRGCLAALIDAIVGRSHASLNEVPDVRLNKYFVTLAEADFFRVLAEVVGERGHVLAQVSLRQLLWFPGKRHTPGKTTWQNKVARRSLDFLVCDPATLRPLLAIELDEPSHATPERQTRDEEVALILERAGLPLIRVLTSRSYDTRELEVALSPYLASK
jgi:hypothetical protein